MQKWKLVARIIISSALIAYSSNLLESKTLSLLQDKVLNSSSKEYLVSDASDFDLILVLLCVLLATRDTIVIQASEKYIHDKQNMCIRLRLKWLLAGLIL